MEELPIAPRGIRFQADFISATHEAELLHIFRNELEWPVAKKAGARLSLHYGYTFDYKTFGIDPDIPYKPFPEWLVPLIPRLEPKKEKKDEDVEEKEVEVVRLPDQVCLQYYPPGAGIPPHVDTHSAYDELYALSLGSPVTMQFRRTRPGVKNGNAESEPGPTTTTNGDGEGNQEQGQGQGQEVSERETVDVDLPPRSMMQMSGDSRLHWEHGIKKRKKDIILLADGTATARPRGERWSITYRWLRPGAVCECGDERLCDTAQRRIGVEREYRWKQQKDDKAVEGEEEEQKQKQKQNDDAGVDSSNRGNITSSPP